MSVRMCASKCTNTSATRSVTTNTATSLSMSTTMCMTMSMGRGHLPKDLGWVLHLGKTCEHVNIFLLGYEKTSKFVNLFWAIKIEQTKRMLCLYSPLHVAHYPYPILVGVIVV